MIVENKDRLWRFVGSLAVGGIAVLAYLLLVGLAPSLVPVAVGSAAFMVTWANWGRVRIP